MIHWLASPPDDPFGPVEQDPDQIRETACRLVAPDSVCSPPKPTAPHPADLGWLARLVEVVVWVLLAAAVVTLVVLLARALLGWTPSRRVRKRRAVTVDDDVAEIAPVHIDRSREPADWRREADEHRRAGRFRDAVRCRYRALVGDLARRGVMDEIPGRTTGEERAQLGAVLPGSAPPFERAADLFDEAWYGRRHVVDADVSDLESLERTVLDATSARASR